MKASNMTDPTTVAAIPRINNRGDVLYVLPGTMCELVVFRSPVVCCLLLSVVAGTGRSVGH
jgi:hypothetical protein